MQTQQDARGLVTGARTTFSYTDGTDTDGSAIRTTRVTSPPTSFEPAWSPTVDDVYDRATGWLKRRVSRPTSTETYTEAFTYDPSTGFRLAATDARGNVTRTCWDTGYDGLPIAGSRGNLTRVIGPPPAVGQAPVVALSRYDAWNNVTQSVTPRGVANGASVDCATDLSTLVDTRYATDHAYDASGAQRLATTTRFTDPELGLQTATTTYEYGDAANPGRVTRVIPPRGNSGPSPDYTYATTFAYFTAAEAPSQAGLLKETTDPLGNRTSYEYDAVGRQVARVDPLGHATGGVPAEHTWSWDYDQEDRVRFVRAPAPQPGGAPLVSETRYDAVGNKTVTLDANGQVTQYVYDERNLLAELQESPASWTDPAVAPSPLYRTVSTYDDAGNLTRVTRAAGDAANERVEEFASDGRGRVRTETQYPSWPAITPTLVASTTYDGNGNTMSYTDPLGRTTTFVYDALNRLTNMEYSDAGTPDVAYSYDRDGNRATMVDGTGTTTYTVDEQGRATSVASPGGAGTVGQRYDLDGNRTKLLYPDGLAVSYTVDQAGRVTGLSDAAVPPRTVAYTYEADGALKTATHPNGTLATYTRDNARRTTRVLHQGSAGGATLADFSYTLDAAGRRTALAETLAQVGGGSLTTSTTYSYDALSRLTGDGTDTYSYDPVGNRLSWNATSTSYDRADRITAAGSTGYSVDAVGNLVARGTDTFGYDQANRLTRATVAGTTTSYTFDGDGQRATATTGGVTTTFSYDRAGPLPLLLADGTRDYVWGAAGLAYTVNVSTGAMEVSHADGLGSMRALTDGAGTLVQTYRTDAFGVPTATQGASTQPLRFTGEQMDSTGLVYLRARLYDPSVGRFVQRDTLVQGGRGSQGLNRYAYVSNNPVNLTDPSGKCPWCVIIAAYALRAAPAIVSLGTAMSETGPSAGSVGTRYMLGRPVPPIEKSIEQALNTTGYIRDVAGKYGINLRGVKAIFDESLPPGQYGKTLESEGGWVIRIGRDALSDERTLANTISHELSHARDFIKGAVDSLEDKAYRAGDALEDWIDGRK